MNNMKFPVSFVSNGNDTVTFTSPVNAVWKKKGEKCGLDLGYFLTKNQNHNPANVTTLDYFMFWPEAKSGECKAEDMPIGAALTGLMLDDESWAELRITPRRIEVDSDVITFLLHTHYSPNTKQSRFAGKVSMNRDAMIRWEKA